MNKTIIININGTVFHIEEDAYEILKAYITTVKRHFADAEDSFEITTDIENRIAEMFAEMLGEAKQVIVTADVNSIITQMGTVDEFGDEPKTAPGNQQPFTATRKLYRDPDDHLLGGVCAGIANYFDIKSIWARLAFILLTPAGGSGPILYIILWLIIPKAVTRADRMAMKGERLDLQGFKKNFEEEAKNVQDTFEKAAHHAKPFVYQLRDFIGDFFFHLGIFLRGGGRIILKLIGIFILLVCFGVALVLFVCLVLSLLFGQHEAWEWFHISLPYYGNSYVLLTAAFLLIILPLVGIIQLTLRIVFNNRYPYYRTSGFTMLIVWIVALTTVVYYSLRISRDFRAYASFSKNIVLKPTANNTYLLTLDNTHYISREDSLKLNAKNLFKDNVTLNENDYDEYNNFQQRMRLNIEKSDVKKPVLVEQFSAHGRDYDIALLNAQNTEYHFMQKDSVFKFTRRLKALAENHFEDQQISLILKLPVNAKVIIDRNIEGFLQDVDVHGCNEANNLTNRPGFTKFTMTDNGLQCNVDTMTIAHK